MRSYSTTDTFCEIYPMSPMCAIARRGRADAFGATRTFDQMYPYYQRVAGAYVGTTTGGPPFDVQAFVDGIKARVQEFLTSLFAWIDNMLHGRLTGALPGT